MSITCRAGVASNAAPRSQACFTGCNRRLRSLALFFLVALSFGLTRVGIADNLVGKWAPPATWPLIAVHSVLTPDGRVLTYGTDGTGKQTGFTIYDVWDATSATADVGHTTWNNTSGTDLFCSSQVVLPTSGNVFIAGGDNYVNGATTNTGNDNSNVFTLSSSLVARGNPMNRARWYSSSTTLLNGETYIQGGSSGGDRPEVRGTDGVFRLLSGANTSGYAELYPRNFIAPNGNIFGFDNTGKMYYVVPTGTGSITAAGQLPGSTSWTSSAAMFRPGRILQMGGASSAAVVIDINGASPVVTATQSMSSQRQWVFATVLPNGRVLATSGSAVDNQLTGVNNSAEIWNPDANNGNGAWFVGASAVNARLYHNTALLLPDSRVLLAGGGAPGPLVNLNAEIYTPPFLLNSAGTALLPRPSITLWPATIDIGQSFEVGFSNAASISRVTMVKTGSTTHSVNMDQRFLELGFQATGSMLDVIAPARAADAPPGYYLLFVLDAQGVPAVGKIVRVNVASNPNPTLDTSPAAGGAGGSPFTLACNANEAVVGVYGTSAGTYVNQAGPQCVAVDQFGHWAGTPSNRGITGIASGTAYTKTCPTNYALSGFRGRSSQYVDQLDFECRALTTQGKVTGLGQFTGSVGGTGGTAVGPYNCGTNNPAYALTGRSGSWLDNFAIACRQAPITITNSAPVVTNPGSQTSTVGTFVDLPIAASDPEGQALTYSASGLPAGLSINATTGHITGTPTTAGPYIANVSAFDGTQTGSAIFNWTVNPAAPFVLNPLPPFPAAQVSTPVTLTASSSNGVSPQYSWFFDDGTPDSPYSSSPSVTHTFTQPGVYYVTVTAFDGASAAQSQTMAQTVYLPATPNRPVNSSSLAYETRSGANSRLWVVNQDNDTVSVFDAVTNAKLSEINVGTGPRSVAIAPDGRIWVVNKFSGTVSIISPSTLGIVQTLMLPFASQPYGVAFAPTGSFAFITLEASGRLLKLDAATGAQVANLDVGPNPRHLGISGDGATVFVSRFVTPKLPGEETAAVQTQNGAIFYGGQVVRVSATSMTVLNTIVLRHSDLPDFENQGSGLPNYLGAPVISPDGSAAWVPSKQDNIKRGVLRNQQQLTFQNTVRAIGSRIDLGTGAEDYNSRLDFDNAGITSALAFDKNGVYMFAALETSREVVVVDAHGRWQIFRFNVGRAPQALLVSPDGQRLYVNNFMDRTVGVFDLSRLINLGESNVPALATLQAVATEKLTAQVLKGKQFFYDALDTRLARDRYITCASCHNDGGSDGRTWDFTGQGEGLRNTITLRGRAGAQGFLHWSANFDEVQDFEGQIRALSGGTGLMSDAAFNTGTRSQPLGDPKAGVSSDLDALAAYVASLNTFASSPNRNSDGTLTSDAVAGKQIFANLNCAQCHSGTAFTEGATGLLRNIGTLKPSSGNRLGGPLTGIDTPTLRDVWSSAPYLHDGSAATLADAVRAHNGVSISDSDLTKLVAYLAQIGNQETSAPTANVAPIVTNPGAQTGAVGTAVNLQIVASDGNGDTLQYSATGLPTGLGININTGAITGTPTTVATYNVTVTATDPSLLAGTASFSWTISADTTPPGVPTGLGATPASSTQINLSWTAPTDNVAVTGYQIDRCQGAGCTNFTQVGTSTTTTFNSGGLAASTTYVFRVRATDAAGNVSGNSATATAATNAAPDTTPPSAPTGLGATATSTSQINLSWTASTDNVAVTGYQIDRCQGAGCTNFAQVGTSATTTFSNTGLSASTTYVYQVRATDAAGNVSGNSAISSATTLAGTPATITYKQGANAVPQSPQTSVTVAFSAAQTAGSLNVVAIGWFNTTSNITGVTDTRGNSYVLAAGPTSQAQAGRQSIYYAKNIAAGANSITVTFDSSVPYPDVRIAEYSGIDTTNPLDVAVSGTGTGTSSNSGNATTTNPNDVLIGANYVTTATTAAGSGFTSRMITDPDGSILEDRTVSATGTYSAAATINSGSWIMQMVAFRAALTGPADTTAPSTPTGLSASAASSTQINLSWTASTDNVAVTGYQIDRCQGAGCTNFAQVGTSTTPSYSSTGLTASTAYVFRVRATDAAGNVSGNSATATATTQAAPDTTPPSTPAGLTATAASTTQINLSWTASTDNVAVTGYQIDRCQGSGCTNFSQIGTSTTPSFSNTGLTSSTAYVYRVRATDAAGNVSGNSATATATTLTAPDTTPPSAPTGLTATAATSTQINLSWTASTDNVAVTGYQIDRCQGSGCTSFVQVGTSATPSYSSTGLTAATAYVFRVRAADAANNVSGNSATATATTFAAGTPATITYKQGNNAVPQSPQTTVSVAFTAAQTAGSLNVVAIGWFNTTAHVLSVTDTRGNNYALAAGPTTQAQAGTQSIYYAANVVAGANTITVTFDAAVPYPDIRIAEYSGVATTNPLDVAVSGTGTGATSSSGSVTTTNPNDLLIGANYVTTATTAAGTGYTSRVITNPDGSILEDRVVTTAGSYSATATLSSGSWIMQMVAFRVAILP